MKILSEKETMCTTLKILISKDDDVLETLNQYKRQGFRVTKRPSEYGSRMVENVRYSPEGKVYTLVKYEPMPNWSR